MSDSNTEGPAIDEIPGVGAIPDRRGTDSIKWSATKGDASLPLLNDRLSMWVADMDYPAPREAIDAIRRRLDHPVLGYPGEPDELTEAAVAWLQRRHQRTVLPEWCVHAPGVMPAIRAAVEALTSPGDSVVVQSPVYFPFFDVPQERGRRLVDNPLRIGADGRYSMDLDALTADIDRTGAKVFLLCSPHNPVGRLWTDAELRALADVLVPRGVVVVSDEIHADILPPGARFVAYADVGDDAAESSISIVSPNKTFNIAGVPTAVAFSRNRALRAAVQSGLHAFGVSSPNALSVVAAAAAYNSGDRWLDAVTSYLSTNFDLLENALDAPGSRLTMRRPEAGYLGWIDARSLGIDDPTLERRLRSDAGVMVSGGHRFGSKTPGFFRINVAAATCVVREAIARIERFTAGL